MECASEIIPVFEVHEVEYLEDKENQQDKNLGSTAKSLIERFRSAPAMSREKRTAVPLWWSQKNENQQEKVKCDDETLCRKDSRKTEIITNTSKMKKVETKIKEIENAEMKKNVYAEIENAEDGSKIKSSTTTKENRKRGRKGGNKMLRRSENASKESKKIFLNPVRKNTDLKAVVKSPKRKARGKRSKSKKKRSVKKKPKKQSANAENRTPLKLPAIASKKRLKPLPQQIALFGNYQDSAEPEDDEKTSNSKKIEKLELTKRPQKDSGSLEMNFEQNKNVAEKASNSTLVVGAAADAKCLENTEEKMRTCTANNRQTETSIASKLEPVEFEEEDEILIGPSQISESLEKKLSEQHIPLEAVEPETQDVTQHDELVDENSLDVKQHETENNSSDQIEINTKPVKENAREVENEKVLAIDVLVDEHPQKTEVTQEIDTEMVKKLVNEKLPTVVGVKDEKANEIVVKKQTFMDKVMEKQVTQNEVVDPLKSKDLDTQFSTIQLCRQQDISLRPIMQALKLTSTAPKTNTIDLVSELRNSIDVACKKDTNIPSEREKNQMTPIKIPVKQELVVTAASFPVISKPPKHPFPLGQRYNDLKETNKEIGNLKETALNLKNELEVLRSENNGFKLSRLSQDVLTLQKSTLELSFDLKKIRSSGRLAKIKPDELQSQTFSESFSDPVLESFTSSTEREKPRTVFHHERSFSENFGGTTVKEQSGNDVSKESVKNKKIHLKKSFFPTKKETYLQSCYRKYLAFKKTGTIHQVSKESLMNQSNSSRGKSNGSFGWMTKEKVNYFEDLHTVRTHYVPAKEASNSLLATLRESEETRQKLERRLPV